MIIVCLMGGLGNQMFQYATAKALSMRYGIEPLLDLSFLEKDSNGAYTKRNYELNAFQNNFQILPIFLKKYFSYFKTKKYFNLLRLLSGYRIYNEKSFIYDKNLLNYGKKVYLIGFFQNEKYFAHIREVLIKNFQFKEDIIAEVKNKESEIMKAESVAVHVRRGDYVKNPNAFNYHGVCSQDYYTNAMKYLRNKLKNPTFYMFSDDLEYCKQTFKEENIIFMENRNAFQDMHLMKLCKHHIIANSSFSWWGAWLSENPEKIVIAPKYWLREKETRLLDVVPESWLVME